MKKIKKLTPAEFVKRRKVILAKIKKYEDDVNRTEYTPLHNTFVLDNCPLCINKVYELEQNGHRRKGFKRFVIYQLAVRPYDDGRFVFIYANGWWLDDNSVPSKWDSHIVFGAGNSAVFKMSDNQVNKKVPKEIMGYAVNKMK